MMGQLGEIILYVEDMQKAVAFYRGVLGLEVIEPAGEFDSSEPYWVLFDTGACKLALHGGGRRRIGEDSPKFVFLVDDIRKARAALLDAGVPIGDLRSPAPGVEVTDCRDPEGHVFSIESRESRP